MNTIPVWDVFVRLCHWLLVAAIAFAWWTVEQGPEWMEWHQRSGYLVLGLVLFRCAWGFAGPVSARFRHFLYGMRQTLGYGRLLLRRQEPPYLSHNPLGGWAVVVLLLLCLVQAATGLFANDDILTEGPLASWVGYELSLEITRWHKQLSDVLLLVIGLHVLAVGYHQWVRREPLLMAMLSGRKPVTGAADVVAGDLSWRAVFWKGLVLAAAVAASVGLLVSL